MAFFEFGGGSAIAKPVRQHLPFSFSSPNGIDPVETFTAFLLLVTAGDGDN